MEEQAIELPEGDVAIWGAPDTESRSEIVRRLYSPEMVKELLAAERERCATECEELRDRALAQQSGTPHDSVNVMLRQVAHLGHDACAAAIRKG